MPSEIADHFFKLSHSLRQGHINNIMIRITNQRDSLNQTVIVSGKKKKEKWIENLLLNRLQALNYRT